MAKERELPYLLCNKCGHAFRIHEKSWKWRLKAALRWDLKPCPNCKTNDDVKVKYILTTWEHP